MLGLLVRLLVFFLALGNYKVKSEVNPGFTKCSHFFYNGTAPVIEIEEYELTNICQLHENWYFYATSYSKDWRIPVFSAYMLLDKETPTSDCNIPRQPPRENTWFVEPQVGKLCRYLKC